ncbi:MAG: 50S ribosomal protein L10 [Nanoarchaeota archaeon]|nr:50S ribosomal protein L10 [Nanoarchaeota archaeon]
MAHVQQYKKDAVSEILKLIESYPVIGVVNMSNLPTKQVQTMRAKLRAKNTILKMTKKTLMEFAFKNSKVKNIAALADHLEGMPALVFTSENPFKLYAGLQKTKSKAPAKAGQKAPKDITVNAGPTSFSPGPVIGQLGKFGIKTGIEGGKIVIKADSVVAKKGDTISAELAGILTRLGVEPMEIGLDLTCAIEDGLVYSPDVLFVDDKAFAEKFASAHTSALNLAVYAAYPSPDTIKVLLGKAHSDSKGLAIARSILTSETTLDIIQKAHREMLSLSNSLPDEALSDELKGSKTAASHHDKPSKPEHKEEKPKEEDAAAGLGSLFG